MGDLTSVISGYKVAIDDIQSEIEALVRKKERYKLRIAESVAAYLKDHPGIDLDLKMLSEELTDNQAKTVVYEVISERKLRPDEITDELFNLAGRYPELGALIFDGLADDKQRLAFATYALGPHNHEEVPEARKFLEDVVGLKFDLNGEAGLVMRGYDPQNNVSALSLETVKQCREGLRETAEMLLKMIYLGYKGDRLEVMEKEAKSLESYVLMISPKEKGSDELNFFIRPSFGPYNRHRGQGDSNEERLMDALAYVADNLWTHEAPKTDH